MRRRSRGFTLIELLVTISMVGILAAIGTVSMTPLLQKQRLAQGAQQVEQVIRKAQQTAMTQSRPVYLRFAPGMNYTLVVGDPCKPDLKATPLVDSANPRIDAIITENLPSEVSTALSTLDDGTCPAPSNPQDLDKDTAKPNILTFDAQGKVLNNNAGRYVRLRSTAAGNNFGNYDVYVVTILGDVGTAKS
jgi:prepilin-type N-terminal cleavage/methylation domain-containing protein